jgi:hypothetical protein
VETLVAGSAALALYLVVKAVVARR